MSCQILANICQIRLTSSLTARLSTKPRHLISSITTAAVTAGRDASSTATSPSYESLLTADTVPTRKLNAHEAIDALYSSQHDKQRSTYAAFYSSELGGIVTEPALMIVHLDDHMVHRGHSVFDTAILIDGTLYQLDRHVARFLKSAAKANISLPPGVGVEQLSRIILETAAASKLTNGFVRYFLSAGRGGFGLSSSECLKPSLYVMVYSSKFGDSRDHLEGWKVKTSPVPQKSAFFAGVKSTNYLPNALNLVDAESEGFDQGIFVDDQGFVSEGPNMNIACLLHDGTLVVPPFDNCLAGITAQRVLELLPNALRDGLEGVSKVEQRRLTVDEAKGSKEVMLFGSSLPVMPVVHWDDVQIGDGTPGMAALQLRALIMTDAQPRQGSPEHTDVPYGYLTNMI